MNSVTNLPTTPTALLNKGVADTPEIQLPKLYLAARQAIEECASIDECRQWADKSAALRAYAVMRDDVALTSYAQRIHLRSVRQIGLLLKQIEPQRGGDRGGPTGGRPPIGETRTQAAEAAGLSEHQRKTALRVASIPGADFEAETRDGAAPPTLTRLAEQGKAGRAMPAATASAGALGGYSKACQTLAQFAQWCERTDPAELSRLVNIEDREGVSEYVAIVERWLEEFADGLESADD